MATCRRIVFPAGFSSNDAARWLSGALTAGGFRHQHDLQRLLLQVLGPLGRLLDVGAICAAALQGSTS